MYPHPTLRPAFRLLVVLFTFVSAPAALSQDRATLIRAVRVFDGTRGVGEADVLVREGKIDAVGKGLTAPDGADVVDGAGKTLLPGLIDAHTHVIAEPMLRQALAFGVTTELDMFMSHHIAAALREKAAARESGIADFRTAGTLVTAPLGHGTQFGLAIPTIQRPEQARKFVEARVKEGSDYIKIVYDTGKTVGFNLNTVNRETLEAVIKAAHERGKLAVVHVQDHQSASEAVDAGADGLVHVFIDREPEPQFVKKMKERNVFVVTTLSVLEAVCNNPGRAKLADDPRLSPMLAPSDARALSARYPVLPNRAKLDFAVPMGNVRRLKEGGVRILAGTDAPNTGTLHGASMHRELELLVEAGLTPAEALAAATSVPARAFKLDDRGRVAPGLRADLLLVEGDPTADVTATRAIVALWKAGRRVDLDAYRREVEAKKQAPAVAGAAGPLLVSDFEAEQVEAKFGVGWEVSTDSIMLGKSTASMQRAEGGAEGSKGCLRVTGRIDGRLPFAWAGAFFSPGDAAFAPADLSAKKAISFRVRGDGKPVQVMLFAESLGPRPATRTVPTGEQWARHSLPLERFKGLDPEALTGVLFAGGPKAGEFWFEVDDVMFE